MKVKKICLGNLQLNQLSTVLLIVSLVVSHLLQKIYLQIQLISDELGKLRNIDSAVAENEIPVTEKLYRIP